MARWAWILFLALSPVAYYFGYHAHRANTSNIREVGLTVDRARAVEMARDFAKSLGLDVSEWRTAGIPKASDELHHYYRWAGDEKKELYRKVRPEFVLKMAFVAPEGRQHLVVYYSPQGELLGFSRGLPSDYVSHDPGEAAVREHADRVVRARVAATRLMSFGK